MKPRTEIVFFGSGSFHRKQELFGALHGVVSARPGYMGGWVANPSPAQVASKTTGHSEVVEVVYDTTQTKLTSLLKAFFSFHDATIDRRRDGTAYRSIVFCREAKQRIVSERAIALLREHGLEVATEVRDANLFWPAEDSARQRPTPAIATSQADVRAAELENMSLCEAAGLKRAERKAFAPIG